MDETEFVALLPKLLKMSNDERVKALKSLMDIPPMRGQRSGRWEATVPAHGRPAFRAMGGQ